MENSVEIPLKTKKKANIWPSNPTTGHEPLENHNSKRQVLTAALFTIARTQMQPRCPTADDWRKKLYIYTMEYHSAIKKEHIWVIWTEVHEPRARYTEWSKSERKTNIIYLCT